MCFDVLPLLVLPLKVDYSGLPLPLPTRRMPYSMRLAGRTRRSAELWYTMVTSGSEIPMYKVQAALDDRLSLLD
jgi:hypothetical protein